MNAVKTGHGLAHMWPNFVAPSAGMPAFAARRTRQSTASRERQPELEQATAVAASTALFVEALCADSQLELDWLWLATQVVREHEIRYCLERALAINPHSALARRELAQLPALPQYIRRLTGEPEHEAF